MTTGQGLFVPNYTNVWSGIAKRKTPRPMAGVLCNADLIDFDQCAAAVSITGSVSNWWNGGGDDSVHSSVVAPSPQ